jgi:hypothetical protein
MANLHQQLSKNFTLWELVRSQKAVELGVTEEQYNPDKKTLDNLKYLCETVLQPLRDRLGVPLVISSGYRCEDVNTDVKGAPFSQHRLGQAADCNLRNDFLFDPATAEVRAEINAKVERATGFPLRGNVNANFYLFAHVCLELNKYDIDQVIHEYGREYGEPAWVHVAASKGDAKNKREILAIGKYPEKVRRVLQKKVALGLGT